jgi:hypothetical protein
MTDPIPMPSVNTNPASNSKAGPGAGSVEGSVASRAEPRLDTTGLHCHAGRVLDMSGTGMRVLVPWKNAPRVGDPETYVFGDGTGEVKVLGTVRWVRPAGRLHKRAEVGVEFVGLTPAKRDALRRLAVSGDLDALRNAEADRVRVEYPDLYRLFGVSPYATDDDIRRAYHTVAKLIHPDHSTDPEAASRFAEINKAYAILRDRELRARYDERLAKAQQRRAA